MYVFRLGNALRNGDWSTDELLRTLVFYGSLSLDEKLHLPKDAISALVQKLPRRSTGSVKMRISNFVARDPQMKLLGIAGLSGGGSHVDLIWERYADDKGNLNPSKLLLDAAILL
jgi:hypothetical protein